MTRATIAETRTDEEFQAKRDSDRAAFLRFHEAVEEDDQALAESPGHKGPGHELAAQYFQFYLDRRPSIVSARALAFAFWLWASLPGVSATVREALAKIPHDEGNDLALPVDWPAIWDSVSASITSAFKKDGLSDEGLVLVEAFAGTRSTSTAEAMLRCDAMRIRIGRDEMEMARQNGERILSLDTSQCPEWVKRTAQGCVHECENLIVGREAPRFRASSLDGQVVDLATYVGRPVLLHFWNTDCPFCPDDTQHLKAVASRYGEDIGLIGVSIDGEIDRAREFINREDMDWPQICDGQGLRGSIPRLYNVILWPCTYAIDDTGQLAAKRVRLETIETTADAVVRHQSVN